MSTEVNAVTFTFINPFGIFSFNSFVSSAGCDGIS